MKESTMKKHSLASKILWITFAALTLTVCVLCTIAVITEYETAENYFIRNSTFAPLSLIIAAVSVVCGIVAACLTKKDDLSDNIFPMNFHIPLTVLGFWLSAAFLMLFAKSTLGLIAIPFLILAGIYCLLTGFKRVRASANTMALLGFSTVLGSILLNAYYYFDFTVEMNAPIKVSLQIGLLMLMLCYTGELRYMLGIQKPKMYLILSVFGITASALCALPICVLYTRSGSVRPDYLAGACLLLNFLLMQIARTVYLLRGIQPPISTDETRDEPVKEDVESPASQEENTEALNNEEEGNEQ